MFDMLIIAYEEKVVFSMMSANQDIALRAS
jgi:hypothetical protein